MKTYEGTRRTMDGLGVVSIVENEQRRDLPPRHDLRNHSPDGFEWGYSGSGPAQLALALCADVLDDDELAMRVYQRVKEKLIAPIRADDWALTVETIKAAIAEVMEAA